MISFFPSFCSDKTTIVALIRPPSSSMGRLLGGFNPNACLAAKPLVVHKSNGIVSLFIFSQNFLATACISFPLKLCLRISHISPSMPSRHIEPAALSLPPLRLALFDGLPLDLLPPAPFPLRFLGFLGVALGSLFVCFSSTLEGTCWCDHSSWLIDAAIPRVTKLILESWLRAASLFSIAYMTFKTSSPGSMSPAHSGAPSADAFLMRTHLVEKPQAYAAVPPPANSLPTLGSSSDNGASAEKTSQPKNSRTVGFGDLHVPK